jgi:DNA-binding transcriptional ArsR family regulator
MMTTRALTATPPDMRIEHQYPEALTFLRHHGPQALAVLHDLLAAAQPRNGGWIVQTSNRDVARRLEFLSKDTVNRRLRQLLRAGVVEILERDPVAFQAPTYRINLLGSGITVLPDDHTA